MHQPLSRNASRAAMFALLLSPRMLTISPVALAQTARGAAEAAGPAPPVLAKTPWGDPDLQGTWPGGPVYSVPFERAPELGTRAILTDEERAKRQADIDAQLAFPPQANYWPEIRHGTPLSPVVFH